MKRFQKMFLAVMFLAVQADIVYGVDPATCDGRNVRFVNPVIQSPPRRSKSVTLRYDSSLICGQNAYCGTLTEQRDYVYGQVGIYFNSVFYKKNLFVPIYAKGAVKFSDNQYKVPKWDGKIFWLSVNPKYPPKPIQPRFIEEDEMGGKYFGSKFASYQKNGQDYSDYPGGAASCTINIEADSSNKVTKHYLLVYDKDGNLLPGKPELQIGDFINLFFSGDYFDDDGYEAECPLGIDDYVMVTQKPQFYYAGYIPGRDIACSHCANNIVDPYTNTPIDLADTELYFRLEGIYLNVDPPAPIASDKQPLGKKLRDHVDTCSQYPNPTLAAPTLADVVEGLRIVALLAPQHFCFRDVNNDGRFDMTEVIWMLQKISMLR